MYSVKDYVIVRNLSGQDTSLSLKIQYTRLFFQRFGDPRFRARTRQADGADDAIRAGESREKYSLPKGAGATQREEASP
uniref:DUF4833 domain-containing protein n=1 Tax=Steinernema glaseri TaxID=37863 RepID=A0A1I7YPS2_9BILA